MAAIEALAHEPYVRGRQLYVRAPRPIDFPSEERPEDKVPETKRHLEARTTLYLLIKAAFPDAAIGSEQFVYWDAGDPQKCLSPDVFLKRGSPDELFDTWKIWERGAPDLALEVVSAFDRRDANWADKLQRYQASGVSELVRFDAAARQPLRVWDRVDGELVERAASSPSHHECVSLGLWWATLQTEYGLILRLANDPAGASLLLTPEEKLQAEASARAAAEEKLRAEATQRAAAEAENEQLRAELARLRAGR